MDEDQDNNSTMDQKPPFFRSWRSIYIFVILIFLILVVLFYWFTVTFS
jgi:hypothetical protein